MPENTQMMKKNVLVKRKITEVLKKHLHVFFEESREVTPSRRSLRTVPDTAHGINLCRGAIHRASTFLSVFVMQFQPAHSTKARPGSRKTSNDYWENMKNIKIWQWLSSRKRLREENELLQEKIKALEKKEREMQILNVNLKRETDRAYAALDQKHTKKVSALEKLLEESIKREQRLKQELEDRTQDLEQKLEDKKRELENKTRELVEKTRELKQERKDREQYLAERTQKLEQELESRKRELEAKKRELAERKKELGERKKTIAQYSDKMLVAQEGIKKLHHRIVQIEAENKRKKNQ
jgi:DNA repair exonuclease SbcCD ATPase subunit